MNIKKYILTHKKYFKLLLFIRKYFCDFKSYVYARRLLNNCPNGKSIILYIGKPNHANLGDLAQGVCIERWIKKNYPDKTVIALETDSFLFGNGRLVSKLRARVDFIVFQSGYTTTDLGGVSDIVHQIVMQKMPETKILMMPQTIFFVSEDRKKQCSRVYNSHKRMLFLARDTVSFQLAKEMFPDISIACYPDIVTTLIGTYESNSFRNGICFCLRNDGEKFYSDNDLQILIDRCSSFTATYRIDTTKNNTPEIVNNAEKYIQKEIETYSKYKVMITDRYHGTILSLVAGTPVIVIKTTDHKVTTGTHWFKGVYDDYVYLAESLDEAYEIAKVIYSRKDYPTMKPFFEKEYYDKLSALFEEVE